MTPIRDSFLAASLLASLCLYSCGDPTSNGASSQDNLSVSGSDSTSTHPPADQPMLRSTVTPDPGPARPEVPPNILVFLIDTQRADFLGAYGHDRPTSPNLDAFALDALVYERAYAAASSTSPSHASIFTSTYPHTHRVWNRILDPRREQPIFPSLSKEAATLAEVLSFGGYATAGICDGGNLQKNRGFAQGFDLWDSKFYGAANRVQRAEQWLKKQRKADQPFFLFLHTYQVHTPYLPDPEHVELFADPDYNGVFRQAWLDAKAFYEATKKEPGTIRKVQGQFYKPHIPEEGAAPPAADDLAFLIALYEAEIHQMDQAFGRLIQSLKEQGLYEDTLIIVTADHGEEFWEHGQYGHHQVYDTTLHVPFIVRAPDGPRGERRSEAIELIDLMPTLLYQADVEIPESCIGRVLDFERPDPTSEQRALIGESNWPERQVAYRVGSQKAMLFPETERLAEVYSLELDPGESQDLAAKTEGKAFLSQIMPRFEAWATESIIWMKRFNLKPGVRDIGRLSAAERAEMIALGYLEEDE
jgi:arylsulfatase A-like enzyme